jgi:hypothetical protein
MNSYDEFISEMGDAPSFPQDVYGKVKFRVTVEKFVLPAALAVPVFIFAAVFASMSFLNRIQPESPSSASIDFFAGTEDAIFSENNNFYALFD